MFTSTSPFPGRQRRVESMAWMKIRALRDRLGSKSSTDVGILVLSQVCALGLSFALTPFQLHAMGPERYGILAVTASLVSYLSFFDIGVGWALTHFVPYYRAADQYDDLQRMIFAGLVLSLTIGIIIGGLIWVWAPWLSMKLLNLSPLLEASATFSIRMAAVCVPLVLVTSVFGGIGRGLGLFAQSGIIRFLTFASLNIAWAVFAPSDRAVELVSVTQVALLVIALWGWVVLIWSRFPGRLTRPTFQKTAYTSLLSYGFFSSVSSFGYLLLNAADKLILAVIIPVREIVFYAIPFTLASQIPVVSMTLALVLFPRFSASVATDKNMPDAGNDSRALADASRGAIALFNGVITLAMVLAGPLVLRVWLGGAFARQGGFVLSALAIGFGVLALGSVDQVFLQAHGRVRTSAGIFLLSGIFGLVSLAVLASHYGVGGAALATAAALAMLGLGNVVAASKACDETPFATALPVVWIWGFVALAGVGVVLLARLALSLPPLLSILAVLTIAMSLGPILVMAALRWVQRWRQRITTSAHPGGPK